MDDVLEDVPDLRAGHAGDEPVHLLDFLEKIHDGDDVAVVIKHRYRRLDDAYGALPHADDHFFINDWLSGAEHFKHPQSGGQHRVQPPADQFPRTVAENPLALGVDVHDGGVGQEDDETRRYGTDNPFVEAGLDPRFLQAVQRTKMPPHRPRDQGKNQPPPFPRRAAEIHGDDRAAALVGQGGNNANPRAAVAGCAPRFPVLFRFIGQGHVSRPERTRLRFQLRNRIRSGRRIHGTNPGGACGRGVVKPAAIQALPDGIKNGQQNGRPLFPCRQQ